MQGRRTTPTVTQGENERFEKRTQAQSEDYLTYEKLLKQKSLERPARIGTDNPDIVDFDGKQYVSVDHVRRRIAEEQALNSRRQVATSEHNTEEKLKEEARKREEESRRSHEELMRLKLEHEAQMVNVVNTEKIEAKKIREALEQERIKREEAEQQVKMAIQATEESVEKRQQELEKKFQEEMRLMKEMMQQEISEQRLLAQSHASKKEGNRVIYRNPPWLVI